MSQRSQICPRTYPGFELRALAVPGTDLQPFDLDLFGLQLYGLALSRQPIGGNAGNLFGRKWRRQLLNLAGKLACRGAQVVEREVDRLLSSIASAFGVIGISGPAKPDCALVAFVGLVIELRQPGKASQHQREDAH